MQLSTPELLTLARHYLVEFKLQIARRGYVLVNRRGHPMSTQGVRQIIRSRTDTAAVRGRITSHMFHHTFAILALKNGVDVKTGSSMLGHYSTGFTLDTYAHIITAAQRQTANTIGTLLAGIK